MNDDIKKRFNFLLRFKKFRGSLAVNHINFFTKDSLVLSVERAGWKVKDVRSFVFKSALLDKITSFISPHLYIIAENNKDFKYHNKKLKEWENDLYYQHLLKITKQRL